MNSDVINVPRDCVLIQKSGLTVAKETEKVVTVAEAEEYLLDYYSGAPAKLYLAHEPCYDGRLNVGLVANPTDSPNLSVITFLGNEPNLQGLRLIAVAAKHGVTDPAVLRDLVGRQRRGEDIMRFYADTLPPPPL